ncbi:MAG TPA: helix-hairpin-helix domain-containing protein, partial [Xanthobacteraceae bacterium]|nr:helix-hairpin-helix domain-containing protein [Xanthobacteraceae bacterium]
ANAREALGRKLAETSSQQRLLQQLAETFGLPRAPRRIEVFDNSHIQGTNAVGAMIVAGAEGFRKNQYRKFNIRSAELTPGDDFAMMREVLERRFKRLLAEAPLPTPLAGEDGERQSREPGEGAIQLNPSPALASPQPAPRAGVLPDGGHGPPMHPLPQGERVEAQAASETDGDESPWPDLLLIDGGQGQLSAARETLSGLGVEVPLVAIAKGPDRDAGRETFFLPGRDSFKLPPRDPVLYFVERLRDEAHRFAIGSHRARRKRDLREAGLQEIAGIGPSRKRALLHHFGTLKAIERAAVTDLMQVDGISAETARRIYAFFHDGAG